MNSHTITVVRPGKPDRFGGTTGGTEFTVPGCIVYPRGSAESNDYAQTVLTSYTVLAPPGADIRATDRVRWQDQLYDVEGLPAVWDHPTAHWTPGQQVSLTRARG